MQGGNGDIDTENRLVDAAEKGEGGTNWEINMETCTLPCVTDT